MPNSSASCSRNANGSKTAGGQHEARNGPEPHINTDEDGYSKEWRRSTLAILHSCFVIPSRCVRASLDTPYCPPRSQDEMTTRIAENAAIDSRAEIDDDVEIG